MLHATHGFDTEWI